MKERMNKKIIGLFLIMAGIIAATPIIMFFVFPRYMPDSRVGLGIFRLVIFSITGISTGTSLALVDRSTIKISTIFPFALIGLIIGLFLLMIYEISENDFITVFLSGPAVICLPFFNAPLFLFRGFQFMLFL